MRILMAAERFLPDLGGVEVFVARLAEALVARGHDVAVIASRAELMASEEECWRGVPVYRLPFQTSVHDPDQRRVTATRRALADLKRRLRPELVHLNTSGLSLVFHLLTRRSARAPHVLTVHWLPTAEGYDLDLLRRGLAAADWVVALTHAGRRHALALDPELGARTSVIYNSLPPIGWVPTPLERTAPDLLCIGRLESQKGFDVAIRALAAVRQRLPAVGMTIAGDGVLRPALERLVAELGLTAAVRFVGWVPPDDVPRLIDAHRVVVMPSRYEPFGLVALQAAQLGRPLVGSRIAGLSEVVCDGDTGVLCPVDDVPAFTAAIIGLLEDRAGAARMSERAQQHAAAAFPWDEYVAAYESLFRRVATQHQPR